MAARSPTMVTLHDTRFVECSWWNDGSTAVTWRSSASTIPAPVVERMARSLCWLNDQKDENTLATAEQF